jgi:hypothetical protein
MNNSRRYELFLPLKFNDGHPVSWELIGETLVELKSKFSPVSWETQIIHGIWQHQGAEFRDDLVRVFVDVPDSAENRQFFINFKAIVKSRFNQLDIWMTTYPVEVI